MTIARKSRKSEETYPHLTQHPLRPVGENPAVPIWEITDKFIVLPRVRRRLPVVDHNEAREVLLDKNTQNAIDMALVITCFFELPTTAYEINK